MTEPGFPDCSDGYPIDAIRAWQQARGKKGSERDERLLEIELEKKETEIKLLKTKAKAAERIEDEKQGNILPRDEYLLSVQEILTITRDAFVSEIPRAVCKMIPKRYHKKVLQGGEKNIRKILDETARKLSEMSEDVGDAIE